MCISKRTMCLCMKKMCVTEENATKTENIKKRDGEANAGSLRYNSASFFCGLSNCFFKCLLNHLDLSVHWKSKKLPGSVLLITVLAQIGAGPDNVL